MRSSSQTPIAALLLTVFDSILEVFLLCLAGYILAYKGILDKKTQKKINHLNVSLFTPALLFSKVAFFLSPAKLRELWVVPIFFLLVTLVPMLVALSLGWMFGLKKSQTSFAMAAAMFMNSNSLPIALMQSLVVSVPHLKWGKDDNKNAMVGRALTYLVVYSTLGMVLRWSYGVRLLSQADDEDDQADPVGYDNRDPEIAAVSTPTIINEHTPFFQNHPHYASTSTFVAEPEDLESDNHKNQHDVGGDGGNDDGNGVSSSASTLLRPPLMKRRTTYYKSFPNSPSDETRSLLPSDSSDDSAAPTPSALASPSDSDVEAGNYDQEQDGDGDREDDQAVRTAAALPSASRPIVINSPPRPKNSRSKQSQPKPTLTRTKTTRPKRYYRTTRRRFLRFWTGLNNFMTVPLWAALASIVVACIRPVQHVLENHVTSFKGALGAAGNCSIPLTLVVLGAYFYSPPEESKDINGVKRSKSAETLVGKVKSALGLNKKGASSVVHDSEVQTRHGVNVREGTTMTKAEKAKIRGETKTVAIAVLSRMVITPLLLMPLVALSAKYDWQEVFEDPVFVVANVLLVSSPPALTLAQITQAASGDAFERLISRTIFWSYCVLTPPATIFYVVVGLLLARL